MSGQKGRSGGPRVGAGRKPQKASISEKQKKKWLKASREVAREQGKTVERVILEMVYDKNVQDSVRIAAAKLYTEALIERGPVIDAHVTEHHGPVVGLPALLPDPALRVVKDKD